MQTTGKVSLYRIKSDNYKPTVAIRHPGNNQHFPGPYQLHSLGK